MVIPSYKFSKGFYNTQDIFQKNNIDGKNKKYEVIISETKYIMDTDR